MDYLSSMYIDNELDLEEKLTFIQKIHADERFFDETCGLLLQEKLLRTIPEIPPVPATSAPVYDFKKRIKKILEPIVYAGAGLAVASLIMLLQKPVTTGQECANRFVIYEPSAPQVELAGTFTAWQRRPMKRIGTTGYWELNLNIPSGEHRFSYILDGSQQMADPTLPVKEKDDFGGENSILRVEVPV